MPLTHNKKPPTVELTTVFTEGVFLCLRGRRETFLYYRVSVERSTKIRTRSIFPMPHRGTSRGTSTAAKQMRCSWPTLVGQIDTSGMRSGLSSALKSWSLREIRLNSLVSRILHGVVDQNSPSRMRGSVGCGT